MLLNRVYVFAVASFGISSCGGGVDLAQQAAQIQATGNSVGYATTASDIDNIPSGTKFVTAPGVLRAQSAGPNSRDLVAIRLGDEKGRNGVLEGTLISNTEIEIDYFGESYLLKYNSFSEAFEGRFDTSTPGFESTLFLNAEIADANPYAKFVTLSSISWVGVGEYRPLEGQVETAVVGFRTDPNMMPAFATYTGSAEMQVFERGTYGDLYLGDAATGTSELTVDFTNSQLTGTIAFDDTVDDVTNAVDLRSFYMDLENGVVNGNSFDADVVGGNITLDAGAISGHFYGPNADHAMGIGALDLPIGTDGANASLLINAAKD